MPKGETVYHYFWRWRKAQVWARIHARLHKQLRVALGWQAQPSAGVIDTPSVKPPGVGGERGGDGAKQVKGRKQHLRVDTHGLVRIVKVHPVDVMDRQGVALLLPPERTKVAFPRLAHVWLDAVYNGQDTGSAWIEQHLGWTTQVVQPPPRRVLVAAHIEPPPPRRPSPPQRAGGGTDLCLAWAEPPAEQRLRAVMRDQ
jgi:putative transposase